jgi:type IV secretion system protein TrbG
MYKIAILMVILGNATSGSAADKDKNNIIVPAPATEACVITQNKPKRKKPNSNNKYTQLEHDAVRISHEWKTLHSGPARGDGGSVLFTYGAQMPSVICAPLFVCEIALQRGETVTDINVGDAVRWKIAPATSGTGSNATTHILVKPTDPGLRTNMLVTTDRRIYVIQLVSHKNDWMPRVAFAYPDEAMTQWLAYKKAKKVELEAHTLPDGHQIANLNFNYQIIGNPPWKPIRVYDDGIKTYIQFPLQMPQRESPALLALGPGGQEQMVNYRPSGDRYIVDKLLTKAILIAGVGKHQEKVEIIKSVGGGS